MPSLCLLGRDHQRYGAFDSFAVGEAAAAAISVGADHSSPSLVFKDDPEVLNEDALCVTVDGKRTGIAVADAHYGPESSHTLINALHQRWADRLPSSAEELALSTTTIGTAAVTDSETALLVAVHDAASGVGFGLSIGDASLVIVGAGGDATPLNPRNHRYVTAEGDDAEPLPFTFHATEGDLVLAFTDGVDECHYRNPATSVLPHHIERIAQTHANDPLGVVEALTHLALSGVDGNPGGQDNIAIVAVLA